MGYKWVEKSYWHKQKAEVENNAHTSYETCRADFHRRRGGVVDVNAWRTSKARSDARTILQSELERARQIRNGTQGMRRGAMTAAGSAKAKIIGGAQGQLDGARAYVKSSEKKTVKYMVHMQNKAGRMKARAMVQAKKEKAAAMAKLRAAS